MMFNLLRNGVRPEFFGGAMWLMMILQIVWWAAVICFVVWIVRSLNRAKRTNAAVDTKVASAQANESALKIVKERYAKGEITKEQYDIYLQDLK